MLPEGGKGVGTAKSVSPRPRRFDACVIHAPYMALRTHCHMRYGFVDLYNSDKDVMNCAYNLGETQRDN